nr:hypothetical protein [Actinocrinis puniceicyclus]
MDGEALALTVGDALTVGEALALTVGDALTVGEALALTVGDALTVGEALALTVGDALALTVGEALALTVGDALTVGEALVVGVALAEVVAVVVGVALAEVVAVVVGVALVDVVAVAVAVGLGEVVLHTGRVTVLVSSDTCPLRASSLPVMLAPVVAVMDVRARMLPLKVEFVPSVAELPTCQNTLHACAPLISATLLAEPVIRVLAISKMNTELGSPWPSSVTVPVRLRLEVDL